ncbi:amidohydrolase family protein [Streptomyces sp. NPDC003717]|uniref:amidohydrolase family protein n=1 Tax=Streptomyces sp. NPDC003717 TaxID=3154276 RepID=UPI0033A024BA
MPQPFALTGATVVTGDTQGTLLPGRTVVVGPDGRIEAVGAAADTHVPPGYRQLDVTGHYVTPGLINAHAHLFADGLPLPALLVNERTSNLVAAAGRSALGQLVFRKRAKDNALTQLHSGVTTLRSVGDVAYEVVRVAGEIDRGKYHGPRILASGPLLAVTGGHGAPQVALVSDSPWDARRSTRINLRRGVKAIKIAATAGVTDARAIGYAGRPEMTEEEMTAICEEAHTAGIRVAAHAQSTAGILASLRAGVDTIEHGARLTPEVVELFRHNPRSLTGSSALIPTIQACLPLARLPQSATKADDIVRANAELVLEGMLQGIRDAREGGVTLGMGTDSAVTYATHYNVWRELDMLVRYGGLTPAEALAAATGTNAAILGLDAETGSVEVGRSADLVVLAGNPLDGFRAFVDPVMVIARGTVIDHPTVERHPDLDAQLDSL